MIKAQSTSMIVRRAMVYSEPVAGQSCIGTVIGSKWNIGKSSIFRAHLNISAEVDIDGGFMAWHVPSSGHQNAR
jgi:hypothetical protein